MKRNISVSVENIFPLIEKFLYSDHEILLRELIFNATGAALKLKHLTSIGEAKIEYGNPIIEVKVDKNNKTLHISDQGISMTAEEVEKYINQTAFPGAEEFLAKYKDTAKNSGVIGHFGSGFYSALMAVNEVEIITKSCTDTPAVRWVCDGSPEFTLEETGLRSERGTGIILHLNDGSLEFLKEYRIEQLLRKYNKFMPVPIKLGIKQVPLSRPENAPGDHKTEYHTEDNIINNPTPAWTKQPADLSDGGYKQFYHELYPTQFGEPLFHIHLNADYPFHLTGILYFPKLSNDIQLQEDRIQPYQNQVFVTDNVEGIVPEFLTILKRMIDSPDISLNISRSYLQADGNVKKTSSYITRKAADRLKSLFTNNREDFQNKWNDIKAVLEYGVLTDEKFYGKTGDFVLYPTTDGQYHTLSELKEAIKANQTDKNDILVVLYAQDEEQQYTAIEEAKAKGYQVVPLDSPITSHLIQKLEEKDEKLTFARVDAAPLSKLIQKDEPIPTKHSEEEKNTLKADIEKVLPKEGYMVQVEDLDSDDTPFVINQPEFMRRMKEMSATGGSGMLGVFPEMYHVVINANSPLADTMLTADEATREKLIEQAFDLARLSQGFLKGKGLSEFVKRNWEIC